MQPIVAFVPRPLGFAALVAGVVVLHGALLLRPAPRPQPTPSPPAAPALQVRQLGPPVVATAAAPPAVPSAQPPAPVPSTRTGAPAPQRPPPTARRAAAPTQASAAVLPDAPPVVETPVYATRLPGGLHARYELRRGERHGEAELHWQPDPDGARYLARLQGRLDAGPDFDWSSQGAIDAAGVAPARFVARQRGRAAQAANMRRAEGVVSFSGTGAEHPWVPGLQDRLSWWLQLPAIVAADPARFASPGAHIVLPVASAHGELAHWRFVLQGDAALTLPNGEQRVAQHWLRAAQRPYDVQVEAWLDAAHALPLQLRLAPSAGPALELRWRGE